MPQPIYSNRPELTDCLVEELVGMESSCGKKLKAMSGTHFIRISYLFIYLFIGRISYHYQLVSDEEL